MDAVFLHYMDVCNDFGSVGAIRVVSTVFDDGHLSREGNVWKKVRGMEFKRRFFSDREDDFHRFRRVTLPDTGKACLDPGLSAGARRKPGPQIFFIGFLFQ